MDMKKYLALTAVLFGFLILSIPLKSHAEVTFSQEPLYDSSGWHYGENCYVTNTFNYAVYATPYVDTYNNVTWSLVNVVVEPGQTVYCGWVANVANSDAWNVTWEVTYEPY